MIRVCVAGITGWTGEAVAEAIRAAGDLELVSGVSRRAAGSGATYASVAEALGAVSADVLVDYTSAETVKANVFAAVERGVAVVVGSSGLTAEDFEEIDGLAREAEVGIVAAGNFSLLAALVLRFAAEAAEHVGAWEIIDYASATKLDVPSGTARELAERLAAVRAPEIGRELAGIQGPVEARGAAVAGTRIHSYVCRASSSRPRSSSPRAASASSCGTRPGKIRRRTSRERFSRSARSGIAPG
jgi:4-hydroxy-tetrahydrodipicolinate reductase